MGRTLLILMAGFAVSFGLLANSQNRRFLDSVDRVVNHFSTYSANNASASGAYMALNQLYLDPDWRDGYNNLMLAGDTLSVTVEDNSVNALLAPYRIRILATGRNANITDLTQVMIFNGSFGDFAVWAKDTVTGVSTKDSLGNFDPSLLVEKAPFMPDIDYNGLVSRAISQGYVKTAVTFIPANGYPNGSFFYFGSRPNVTHVTGNLAIKGGRTVYGIFIVEGNTILEGNARLQGILYLPNRSSTIIHGGGDPSESSITGAVVTWGTVDGMGSHISVRYEPVYVRAFIKAYAPHEAPIRVLSWQ